MRVAHYNVTMVRICAAAAAAATAAWRASIVISFALPDGSVQSTEDGDGHSIVECEECAAESNKNVRHLGFLR